MTDMSEPALGPQQQAALDDAFNGKNLFISGPAGCGKSHVTREIVDGLRMLGKTVAVTGSTGMAAVNVSGLTIHSCLGTGLARNRKHAQRNLNSDQLAKATDRLGSLDTIVLDEVSMLTGDFIGMMDWWLRLVRHDESPFGGVQMIFVGDPLQLPPVIKKDDKVEHKYFFESPAWSGGAVTPHFLTKNYRQAGDGDFRRHLLRVRKGATPQDTLDYFNERVCADLGDVRPTRLRPTNEEADQINEDELEAIKSPSWTSNATFDGHPKWVEAMQRSLPCVDALVLKEGAEIRFLKNNFGAGYVNGSRGVVVSCSNASVTVRLRSGTLVQAEKAKWEMRNSSDKVLASVTQFPVKLAYACTIHASQGMTLDELEFGPERTFGHAMAYVALSRCRAIEGLRLTCPLRREHIRASGRVVSWCRAQREAQAQREQQESP